MFRFLDWKVYKDSREVFKKILEIIATLPNERRFDVGSQLTRSALSISLNIAEGSGKHSDKEMNRFFNIALGSVNETVASLDILRDNKLITGEKFDQIIGMLREVTNQLGGFKKKLRSKNES